MRTKKDFQSVGGGLTESEGSALYTLARSSEGPILEMGTEHGRSTCYLAQAVQDRGKVCLRPAPAYMPLYLAGADESLVSLRLTLALYGLMGLVTFLEGDLVPVEPYGLIVCAFVQPQRELSLFVSGIQKLQPRVVACSHIPKLGLTSEFESIFPMSYSFVVDNMYVGYNA